MPRPQGRAKCVAEDLFRKIRADLDLHAVQLSDHQIRTKMDEALAEARESFRTAG